MNLPRHTLSSHASSPAFVDAHFHRVNELQRNPTGSTLSGAVQGGKFEGARGKPSGSDGGSTAQFLAEKEEGKDPISLFACATRQGYFIARTHPLEIVTRRDFSSRQGGLSHVSLIDNTSLLVLVGGGRVPRFAPNKVILWDEEAIERVAIRATESVSDIAMSSSSGTASLRASTLFSASREGGKATDGESTSSQPSTDARQASPTTTEEVGAESGNSPVAIPGIKDTSISLEVIDQNEASSILSAGAEASVVPSEEFSEEGSLMKDRTESAASSPVWYKDQKRHSSLASTTQPADSVAHMIRKGKEVAELEFGETVKNICLKTFRIASSRQSDEALSATVMVVILDRKAVVFEMGSHLTFESQLQQGQGSGEERSWGLRQRLVVDVQPGLARGMASLAPIPGRDNCVLLALPGRQAGHVQLLSVALSNTERTPIRSSIAGASTIIAAHTNPISNLTLSHDGSLLCTTSERGTLLRIWSTFPRASSSKDRAVSSLATNLVSELRRGSDSAKIWSVSFSPDARLLAAASDTGTIHFFDLQPLHEALYSTSPSGRSSPSPAGTSSHSVLSKNAQRYLPTSIQQVAKSIPASMLPQYIKSQWSFAQYRIPLKVFSSFAVEGGTPRSSQPLFSTRKRGKGKGMEEKDEQLLRSAAASGNQVSLEGGWAGMKVRLDEVRRGEKGIEEGVWLDWIIADDSTKPPHSVLPPSSSSASTHSSSSSSKVHHAPSCGFELVAITSSGRHYRIGVALPPSNATSRAGRTSSSSHTVLDMYREDTSSNVKMSDGALPRSSSEHTLEEHRPRKPADVDKDEHRHQEQQEQQCWLVEFQRFGTRDDWID